MGRPFFIDNHKLGFSKISLFPGITLYHNDFKLKTNHQCAKTETPLVVILPVCIHLNITECMLKQRMLSILTENNR